MQRKGSYDTINEALDVATRGTIMIEAGTYRESLSVNRDVSLVGEGEVIVIGALSSVLNFRANYGRIENITFRQSSNGSSTLAPLANSSSSSALLPAAPPPTVNAASSSNSVTANSMEKAIKKRKNK